MHQPCGQCQVEIRIRAGFQRRHSCSRRRRRRNPGPRCSTCALVTVAIHMYSRATVARRGPGHTTVIKKPHALHVAAHRFPHAKPLMSAVSEREQSIRSINHSRDEMPRAEGPG